METPGNMKNDKAAVPYAIKCIRLQQPFFAHKAHLPEKSIMFWKALSDRQGRDVYLPGKGQ